MYTMADFDRMADEVRNWGRWGDADELGTLNHITDEKVREAASLVRRGKVFPLGVAFGADGPQGMFKFRTNPIHLMTIDGGDAGAFADYARKWTANPSAQVLGGFFDASRFRFNDDYIMMPLQAATQWDALSHAYYDGHLYNGFPADSVTSQGAIHCGIDKVDSKGIVSRGVLLDLVRHRGAETALEPGQPITPEELDEVARAQGVTIGKGDIVLVRTGWWNKFLETGDVPHHRLRPRVAGGRLAARPRGGRGGLRQHRRGGPPQSRDRGHVHAAALPLPAGHGTHARGVLGHDGPRPGLRR